MSELPTTTQAIRAELFRKAETINKRLLARFADVAGHVSRREERAVIGTLEGTEVEILRMRSLMLLCA